MNRERFYNNDPPYILPTTQTTPILAGEFNCILSQTDSTGQRNCSSNLANLVNCLSLTDVYETKASRRIYTQYTPTGASRLDRIYISRHLQLPKKGIETISAAFTDHLAVAIQMATENPILPRRRGYWKMNTSLLRETEFRQVLQEHWNRWKTQKILPKRCTVVGTTSITQATRTLHP